MKRILLFLSMLLCLTAANAQKECDGGDKNPVPTPEPTRSPRATGTIPVLRSGDPNEIEGPIGYDSVRWVSINDILNYTIRFENDPKIATAAAQIVDIRFDFPNKLWMKDFGIGAYCFSNLPVAVDKPSNAYQNRVDLKDSLGIYVDLIAGLDVAKKQGFWNFSTLDAETGIAPWEPDKGMLPVNDSLTHVGEGFVTFQIKPHTDVKTGDSISIMAKIVFDQNDTIPTNTWTNKIDAGMPESKLTAELHPTLPNVYNIKFTGKDDEGGSGIKHILLYMANHDDVYEEIDTCKVDSVLAFPVEEGRQYKLYSIAVDNTGNRESAKTDPDVILNMNAAPTDITLSNSDFQDDLEAGGFIGRLTSTDSDDSGKFTYALAEGDGAIHNDLFQIDGDQLQIKNSFKCADECEYKVRISTTDDGGMTFSKAFVLNMKNVLVKPDIDTLEINICQGDVFEFNGKEYDKAGMFTTTKENEFMCDSVYVLKITVSEKMERPIVTTEDGVTLVSSAVKNNQWFREDGTPVVGATEQKFTPEEDGVYYVAVSNGSCFSDPSQSFRYVANANINLTMDLKEGWNWISSNLSAPAMQDAKQFLAPIAEDVSRLVGFSNELTNDPQYGLVGNLEKIEPEQGYKLKMSQSVNHTLSGYTSKPETSVISLHKGWNWIGYVPAIDQSVSDALTLLNASENAIIKSEDDFATFANGAWTGTLDVMEPGRGYMYYSDKDVTFTYPVKRLFVVTDAVSSTRAMAAMTRSVAPWRYNEYEYPDNTTMIAKLLVNGEKSPEGAFSVGAFSGNECRGVGKYVDGLLFITVHGQLSSEQQITFKAVNNITGDEYTISETIDFNGQNYGTINQPFILNAKGGATGIETVETKFNIYPKPLRNMMYINGPVETIKTVHILSTNGQKMISTSELNGDGIDVTSLATGVYVVVVTKKDGSVYYEKVLKD